jgi:hypothetical protein
MLDGYHTQSRIFQVPGEGALTVELPPLTGTLEAKSSPPGATITIDGEENAQKTPARIALPIGKHTVTLSLPGKAPVSRSFILQADATQLVNAEWEN